MFISPISEYQISNVQCFEYPISNQLYVLNVQCFECPISNQLYGAKYIPLLIYYCVLTLFDQINESESESYLRLSALLFARTVYENMKRGSHIN